VKGPARIALAVAWVAAGIGALASAVFLVHSLLHRPDNSVEAELGIEALRVARRLPLYVDPAVGALDMGLPPTRYYVLYTPFWSELVGHLAGPTVASVHHVGRAISLLAWAAMLALPVVFAPRDGRRRAALAALVASSVFFLCRNAPSGTPDTLAAALACAGLVRAARRDGIDGISAALLLAAPFAKPSALGIIAGCAIVHLVRRRAGWLRTVAIAAGVFAALIGLCHLMSGGQWLTHIVRSTGQPLSGSRWLEQQGSRVLFLGAPHLVVAFIAWRRRASWMTIVPLLTSVAWSSFSMAKLGSGTHYWLEPTAAAIVAIAFLPPATHALVLEPIAAAACALVATASSLASYTGEIAGYRTREESVAAIDRHCVRAPGEVVASTDIGLEIALNGRFLVPAWQSSILARSGRFPLDAWRQDVHDPHVRWLVLDFDQSTPLGAEERADPELSALRLELANDVAELFALDAKVGNQFVYKRR
jgi:hypothetical protein